MPSGSKKFHKFMRNIKTLQNLLSRRDSTLGSDWLKSRSSSSWALSDEGNTEFCDCHTVPPDVPHGFLAVYVGNEKRRFVIHAQYLSHPLFKVLLDKSAEEFGFDQKGGLHLPCEVEVFEDLMMLLNKHDLSTKRLLLNQHDLSASCADPPMKYSIDPPQLEHSCRKIQLQLLEAENLNIYLSGSSLLMN